MFVDDGVLPPPGCWMVAKRGERLFYFYESPWRSRFMGALAIILGGDDSLVGVVVEECWIGMAH